MDDAWSRVGSFPEALPDLNPKVQDSTFTESELHIARKSTQIPKQGYYRGAYSAQRIIRPQHDVVITFCNLDVFWEPRCCSCPRISNQSGLYDLGIEKAG